MRRIGIMTSILAAAVLGSWGTAHAAPALRLQVDQSGDFVMIGNTLAQDCGNGTPAPVVGNVGACGNNTGDSAPDVFWRADDAADANANTGITVAQSRSTAVLALPAGANVTHAFLYWAAESPSGNQADTTATLDRPGTFTQAITAIDSDTNTWQGTDFYYQSVADVTTLIQTHGDGPYRVSGVDTFPLANRNDQVIFSAWSLVVFYELPSDPPRNLALFDGLDLVATTAATATLSGFLVPNAGFDAKLGVITYEGDGQTNGDELLFGTAPLNNGDRLSDAENPINNFFNSSRSRLGQPVSVVGDLPQLTGGNRSMSSFDLDVVDITDRLAPGQNSADIEATTTGDVYFLGAFITSISTYKPNFATSTKTVTDLNGGGLLPGDVLEYVINVVNTGNDMAVNLELLDPLPVGITYVPGTLEIVSGANAGVKTDATDTDQGEYLAASRTVSFRLGAGADGTMGGSLPIGESTSVKFRVTVDAGASGTIENQADISAEGDQGSPQETTPTDGNGGGPGAPPTPVVIDACGTNADCTNPALPVCNTTPNPNVCVQCLASTDCSGNTPVCNASNTCIACSGDGDCGGSTPACQASGGCGECSATNSTLCTGTTPVCNAGTGVCVACSGDSDCGGSTPACQTSGACGQCSATNSTACVGGTPVCDATSGTCVQCTTSTNCSGATPVCTGGTCVGCTSDSDCSGSTPACQPSGACGECSATNSTQCTGATPACLTSTATCVECVANGDCAAPSTCDTTTHTCVCVPSGAEVCGNNVDEDCDGQLDNGCEDTDGDGLSDALEAQIGTDPNDADSDDDGLSDGEEVDPGVDTDGDGLINALDPDSDNDGLYDGTETGKDCSGPGTDASAGHCVADADGGATVTDPLMWDTDGGGASDGSEDANLNGTVDGSETDPTSGNGADDANVTDTDGDGLSDALEGFLGSNPDDGDTDDDGVLDGMEANPSDDTDGDGLINVLDVDSDNDALYDGTEMGKNCDDPSTDFAAGHCVPDGDSGATMTSPLLKDTDGGGASDGSEDANLDGVLDTGETDPTAGHGIDDGSVIDTDGDGLSDALEDFLGSNPNDADSDDDGLLDGDEPNPSDDTDGDSLRNILDPDSDADGLWDGTESGKDCQDPPTDPAANNCIADGDNGATTTHPLIADTDGGGVIDGEEDANHNGVIDPGERDPNNPIDDTTGQPCTTDSECGGLTSGMVCDGAGVCVAGCRGTNGNGCPTGEVCTSTDDTIGQCITETDGGTEGGAGASGAAGSAGIGGSGGGTAGSGGGTAGTGGGAAGTGGSAGAGTPATDETGVLEGGGCSCSTPTSGGTGLGFGLLTALGTLLVARRRRNQRK